MCVQVVAWKLVEQGISDTGLAKASQRVWRPTNAAVCQPPTQTHTQDSVRDLIQDLQMYFNERCLLKYMKKTFISGDYKPIYYMFLSSTLES